jgi:NTE family protein
MESDDTKPWRPAQIALVLQGGGALGAYQAGVYQGLCEAGIVPDWVIGTSIGAINGAIIAGNAPAERIAKLREFWSRISSCVPIGDSWFPTALPGGLTGVLANFNTMMRGITGFFVPNPRAAWGIHAALGVDAASFYTTEPLKATLADLVDFATINSGHPRLTVGAVNVRSGEMKYFDSRAMTLGPAHIMASGALPPAFPAIRIDGELYWDGGIYSNTPVEAVLDDVPRRETLIFSVNVWRPTGAEPQTIWQVLGRQKDIQYSSRIRSHIARQEQIHRLRHIVEQLCARLPEGAHDDPMVREMADYGCRTTMHLVRMLAPRRDGEDHTKDIDFSRAGIAARWEAGLADTKRMLAMRPWERPVDMLDGIVVHESTEPGLQPAAEAKHH